jgi:hypothetical protein
MLIATNCVHRHSPGLIVRHHAGAAGGAVVVPEIELSNRLTGRILGLEVARFLNLTLSLTLANFEQAYRPRGMRNIGSLSTIS